MAKGDFENVTELKVLKMETFSWIIRSTKCSHKVTYDREAEGAKSKKGDMTVQTEGGVMCFEDEDGAMSQGMQVPLEAGKDKEVD
jgi:hypothetical protein